MIGWLIDLVFSNFWLFIVLFWALGSFSKKEKQAKPESPPVRRQVPTVPRQVSWERDFEPVIPKPVMSVKPVNNNIPESTPVVKKQVEHQHHERKRVEPPLVDPIEMPSPVQGMMWSQIYGPPRSKQPHRRLKR